MAVVALWLVISVPAPAFGHAVLIETIPGDGETLMEFPGEVLLRFDEPVETTPASIRVYDAGARRVDLGDARATGPGLVRVGLPDRFGDGSYLVTWRVVSADGHPIRGGFVFSVGSGGPGLEESLVAELLGAEGDAAVGVAAWLARWIAYASVLVAAGGLILRRFIPDAGGRRGVSVVRLMVVAGVVASGTQIPLLGLEVTGLGFTSALSSPVLTAGIGSTVGVAALVRVIALVGIGVIVRRPRSVSVLLLVALAVAGELITGHTRTTDPAWLLVSADGFHLLAAMIWVGGLALVVFGDAGDGSGRLDRELVRRYADLALRAVVVLAFSGLAMAIALVDSWDAVLGTNYGRTLSAKVVLVAAVLALALHGRRNLVPRLVAEPLISARLLGTMRMEIAGLALVVAVTAALVNLAPGSAPPGPFSTYVPFGEHQLNVVVDPARVGTNEFHFFVLTPGGLPALVTGAATLELRHVPEDIGPIVRPLTVAGSGHYLYIGSDLMIPGPWELTVRRQAGEFDEVVAVVEVEVGR